MRRGTIFSIVAFVLVVVITQFFNSESAQEEYFSKKAKIYLREIGNQLLLSNQDSTSLILPISKVDSHQFELSFQSELSFYPDSLVNITKSVLDKLEISKNYIVEVIQCEDAEVAYSYEMNIEETKTIIPCASRVVPSKCYTIRFQFLDQEEPYSKWFLYVLFFIVLMSIEIILYRNKAEKIKKCKEPNYTSIGSFRFYPEQNKLIKEAKEITLSKKECELLEIFVSNPNKILKREDLTKQVWEDNGVFVGRSLDTYISKLRKKLQEDDRIKITNVHGVGYKLEV